MGSAMVEGETGAPPESVAESPPACPPVVNESGKFSAAEWTLEKSDQLQAAVDKIFGAGGDSLLGLNFSFTIADPQIDGCPLIGCSTGFTTLCGYEMPEIVGRNCRFLVDPVPAEEVDQAMRRRCRDFCLAAKEGKDYRVPPSELDPWLPEDRPANELFAVQKNARKDGTLFNNMFHMRTLGLGDFDEEGQYIIALQSELPGGRSDLALLADHLKQLDKNMAKVEKILAKEFIITGSMRRQDGDPEDSDEEGELEPADKSAADEGALPMPSSAKGA
mmetsp:Transcript_63229/g.116615  ORF Transcript_63229/g.116615 Transcript_63229/m.116615 type:complete len:276 (-) Transcript_63229:120-947(-)